MGELIQFPLSPRHPDLAGLLQAYLAARTRAERDKVVYRLVSFADQAHRRATAARFREVEILTSLQDIIARRTGSGQADFDPPS